MLNWEGRVSISKIRNLYKSDAEGMINVDLLDEIGYSFFVRISQMFEIDNASRGNVKCKKCGSIIKRKKKPNTKNGRIGLGKGNRDDELLVCQKCKWEILWSDYYKSYAGKNLLPNAALKEFAEYIAKWPQQKNTNSKMYLVDWLIHQFHVQYENIPIRPTAINLINGSANEIFGLLNELAYSDLSLASNDIKDEYYKHLYDEYRSFINKKGGIGKVKKLAEELGISDIKHKKVKALIDEIRMISNK